MKRKEEEQADKEGGEEKNEGQSGAEGEREEERARSKPEEGPSIESMLSKFPDITWDGACKFTLGNTFAPGELRHQPALCDLRHSHRILC
eukprot:670669-Rhodomonas_salina.1